MKDRYKNYKNCLKDQEVAYNDLLGYLSDNYEDAHLLFTTKDGQQFVIKDLSNVFLNGVKITEVLFRERHIARRYEKYIGYLKFDAPHFEIEHMNQGSRIYWPSISNLFFD